MEEDALRAEMARIIAERDLTPLFQPIVDLATGAVVGHELLTRGPAGSALFGAPALFEAARTCGLTTEVDRLCITVGLTALHAAGVDPGYLFVNIEPAIRFDNAFQDEMVALIHASPFPVVAEFTERSMTRALAELLAHADLVRGRTGLVAVDDLGADPQSLALVPLLQPDILKLDISVTQGTGDTAAATAAAVWEYASGSGATVLAEGIETEAHRLRAVRLGARWGQGWLFGRPVPATDLVPVADRAPWPGSEWGGAGDVTGRTREVSRLMLDNLSRQIEDHAHRRGPHAVLLAAVERDGLLAHELLGRYAAIAERAALVGLVGPRVADRPAPGVQGGRVPEDHALAGAWAVAVVGPHFGAALVARPIAGRDGWYDAVWTQDPGRAASVARLLAGRLAPQRVPSLAAAPDPAGDAGYRELLSRPGVRAAAATTEGLLVDAPPALAGLISSPIAGRTLLDTVAPTSHPLVFSAWERVQDGGATWVSVQLTDGTPAIAAFQDLRDEHGVFLTLLLPVAGVAAAQAGHTGPGEAVEPDEPPRRSGWMTKGPGALILSVDDDVCALLGFRADALVGLRSVELIHPDDRDRSVEAWVDLLSRPGEVRRVRLRHLRGDGSYIWCDVSNHNLLADAENACVRSEIVDVDAEVHALEDLAARERTLRTLAQTLPAAVVVVDADGRVAYANDRLTGMVGSLGGSSLEDVLAAFDPTGADGVADACARALVTGEITRVTAALPARGGVDERLVEIDVNASGDGGLVLCASDVTVVRALEKQLLQQATRDALTGTWNRASILDHVENAAAAGSVAVVFIDLDDLKDINDELGHAAGDDALIVAARQLAGALRAVDRVGRLGGDEFLAVCSDVTSAAAAERLAATVRRALNEGYPCTRASVGVAWSGAPTAADRLVESADAAMYAEKQARRLVRDAC